jgi:FkbM family methyltransferase
MIDTLYRAMQGFRNYRNPLSMLYQRVTRARLVTVVDRKTGLRFQCRPGADAMMAETLHAHVYDLPFAPLRTGDVVFDIGANHGFYACWAASQGATVHAFEPDPHTFDLLVANIRINGLEENIAAHPFAVGSETGDTQIFCTDDLGGGMSTTVPAFAVKTGIHVIQQTTVKVLSLPDALARVKANRIRICKLDCEGAEYSILAGLGRDMLDRFDAFALEYHPQAYKLLDLMNILLSWEDFHISRSLSQNPDVQHANLSAVRAELIRNWSDPSTIGKRRGRLLVSPYPESSVVDR